MSLKIFLENLSDAIEYAKQKKKIKNQANKQLPLETN